MQTLHSLAYVTLFAPLVAAIVITLFTQRWKKLSGLVAIVGAVVLSKRKLS